MSDSSQVNLATLFESEADRNLSALAGCYDDHQMLVSKLQEIAQGILTTDNLCGKRVLLKPNWVRHSLCQSDGLCLRTHDSFLLAVLDVILESSPSSVVIGDAPIQGCDWERMISPTLVGEIETRGRRCGIPIPIKDFRRRTFNPTTNDVGADRHPLEEYVIFDLGPQSFLEPITDPSASRFRVTNYDPDRMTSAHAPGVHKYCITRELFDADVVLSLPKVKTHQKAGITAALKNVVGLNGDKDFLPHHRLGGTAMGGDCYPGKNWLRYGAERAMDQANRRQGRATFALWQKTASFLWHASFPSPVHQFAAGWYGNDTTWRMVMDLNRIATHAMADGTLSPSPVREIYSLCDGIIGGEGDGPLMPEPLALGVASFSNDSYLTDLCWAVIMGLDVQRVPLLSAAARALNAAATKVVCNGTSATMEELEGLSLNVKLPPGWGDYACAESR